MKQKGLGVFVCFVFDFKKEIIITPMFPLHILYQQLMVKFENNHEG